MKQPWPSSNDSDIKEQTRPKLAQTLNSRTRSKLSHRSHHRKLSVKLNNPSMCSALI
jgi:hypothetical protein